MNSTAIADRYILHDQLGEGGMGVVYRATDRLTNQRVAFKQVRPLQANGSQGDTTIIRTALANEFQMLASLRHPHIINVLDYGFDEQKQPYFTMTLLDQPETIVEACGGHPFSTKVNMLVQLLQALAYLHRRGVLHRDIKPANVLVADGTVYVLDFGLATLRDQASEESVAGTLSYMAPEVLQGQPVSEAADIYAVGVLAYEIFVGHHPFQAQGTAQLIRGILEEEPDFSALKKTTQLNESDVREEESRRADPDLSTMNDHLALTLGSLLAKDPDTREPSAEMVINKLCEVMAQPIPVESEAIRESFLQAAKFVGRDAEMDQLLEALALARSGQGSAWLIGGESGVGKSRLLNEVRIQALVHGAVTLRGQAVREGGRPYAVWQNILQRLVLSTSLSDVEASVLKTIVPNIDLLLEREIDTPATMEPQQMQERLFGTVVSMFRRQTRPTLLILEDVHWSTQSLELINRLNALVQDLPLMIIASYRDDEHPTLPEQITDMQLMKLKRLTADDTASLAASMIGSTGRSPQVVELLQRETEGNAFFLVEVVRALAEEAGMLSKIGTGTLPEHVFTGGVQEVVRRRLNRVPRSVYALLKVAAALGREIDLDVLQNSAAAAQYARGMDDWLTVCANSAILELQDDQWRFAHDKLREGLLMDLDATERAGLHRQGARALEATYPDQPEYAAALAFQWRQAGDTAKEKQYARLAGSHALGTSAFKNALPQFERVLELENNPAQRAFIHYDLGEVHRSLSEYDAARSHYQQAQQTDDDRCKALALLGLGRTMLDQGQHEAAREALEQSLALFDGESDTAHRSYVTYALSRAALYAGDIPHSNQLAEEALTLARQSEAPRAESLALFALGMGNSILQRPQQARDYLQQAQQIDHSIGNRRGEAFSLMYIGAAHFEEQHYASGLGFVQQTLEIAQDIGDRRLTCAALINIGFTNYNLGNPEEASSNGLQALSIAQEIGDRRSEGFVLLNLSDAYLALGDATEALIYAQRALDAARELDDAYNEVSALGNLGLGQMLRDETEQAVAYLNEAAETASTNEFGDLIRRTQTALARVHLHDGQLEAAQTTIEAALKHENPDADYDAPVMQTLILLCREQMDAARAAHQQARAALDASLTSAPEHFHVYYADALAKALHVLLVEPAAWPTALPTANDAYQQALSKCSARGVLRDALLTLRALESHPAWMAIQPLETLLDTRLANAES